jgi:hypothetical protein
MKKKRRESVETLRRWIRLNDQNALDETYRIFVERIPAKLYESEEGWRNLVDVLSLTIPRRNSCSRRKWSITAISGEIDQSGFIEALYR